MICTVFYLCVLVLVSIPFLISLLSENTKTNDTTSNILLLDTTLIGMSFGREGITILHKRSLCII